MGKIVLGPRGTGWTCFDCCRTFETWNEALDHFAFVPAAEPACMRADAEARFAGAAHFQDAPSARAFFERHLWPDGPACPHCGAASDGNPFGLHWMTCKTCAKGFNLLSGTVFSGSHLEPHHWLRALRIVAADRDVRTETIRQIFGCSFNPALRVKRILTDALDGEAGDARVRAMADALLPSLVYRFDEEAGGWTCEGCGESYAAWIDAAAHFRFRPAPSPACCASGDRGLQDLAGRKISTFAD